jgi:hypothetical protein
LPIALGLAFGRLSAALYGRLCLGCSTSRVIFGFMHANAISRWILFVGVHSVLRYYFFRLFAFFRGTFAPDLRASDRPIAIACFLLLTLRPDRPLRNVPFLRSCMARLTLLPAFFPYRAMTFSTNHLRPVPADFGPGYGAC